MKITFFVVLLFFSLLENCVWAADSSTVPSGAEKAASSTASSTLEKKDASSSEAAEAASSATSSGPEKKDIFSEAYFEESKLLASSTSIPLDDFPVISHEWASGFITNLIDKLNLYLLTEQFPVLQGAFPKNLAALVTKEKKLLEENPFANIHEFKKSTLSPILVKEFRDTKGVDKIRSKLPLKEFLNQVDPLIANLVLQGRAMQEKGPGYFRQYKTSFENITHNLLSLRSELELASWVELKDKQFDYIIAENAIKDCIGKIFFVEVEAKPEEGKAPKRALIKSETGIQFGTGTAVEIHENKFILTSRHFNPITDKNNLEIYFIPHSELNPEDYLPKARIGKDIVNWEAYGDYIVTNMFLYNGPGMISTITIAGSSPVAIPEKTGARLRAQQIKSLKKLEDKSDYNDSIFMQIRNPDKLTKTALVMSLTPKDKMDKAYDPPNVWAAGYPATRLANKSLAVVRQSISPKFKAIINYSHPKVSPPEQKQNYQLSPNRYYRISSFPVAPGISGGPVFTFSEARPVILATLTGIDFEVFGTLCSTFTEEMLDFLPILPVMSGHFPLS